VEELLDLCSLLPDVALENDSYELENDDMAMGYEQNEEAE